MMKLNRFIRNSENLLDYNILSELADQLAAPIAAPAVVNFSSTVPSNGELQYRDLLTSFM